MMYNKTIDMNLLLKTMLMKSDVNAHSLLQLVVAVKKRHLFATNYLSIIYLLIIYDYTNNTHSIDSNCSNNL
jgi:hypothetical protein